MPTKANRPKVPKFETESEEARWWDEHRDLAEQELIKAIRDGTVQRGTAQELSGRAKASKNITIRMPVDDIERARRLAGRKGLGYQTYIKMLLHEALNREGKEMDRIDLEDARAALAEPGKNLPLEKVKKELGLSDKERATRRRAPGR